jgi:hypothetical protein
MLDRLCGAISPTRRVLSVQDGEFATQYFLRHLPEQVHVVGRFPKNSPLYDRPPIQDPGQPRRRGRPPTKGPRLGTPCEFADQVQGWRPHPNEAGAEVRLVEGLWPRVLPGLMLRVVLVRRLALRHHPSKRKRQRWLEAFFTTAQELNLETILQEYQGRWSIEITIWQARQSFGLGRDRCRRYRRIVGINGLRLVLMAAQVLWFADRVAPASTMDLRQYRPWYVQKEHPSLHDIAWACREQLYREGIFPKVGFWDTMEIIHEHDPGGGDALPRAA